MLKVDSVWSSTLPKIRITSKKDWNKNCSELIFIRKSLREYMSIFPPLPPYGTKTKSCRALNSIQSPQLHSVGRYTCAPTDFFVWNSMRNNFYWRHFLIFLWPSSPKLNLLYHFCTFSEWNNFTSNPPTKIKTFHFKRDTKGVSTCIIGRMRQNKVNVTH